MLNTYFVNLDRLQKASNDDSFLFSKQIQDLANELIKSVPKEIDETSQSLVTSFLFGGVK